MSDFARLLSPDFAVGVVIYSLNYCGEVAYYTRLVSDLEGKVSPVTVSRVLDSLSDCGIVESEWVKHDGRWVRGYTISQPAVKVMKCVYDFMLLPEIKKRGVGGRR